MVEMVVRRWVISLREVWSVRRQVGIWARPLGMSVRRRTEVRRVVRCCMRMIVACGVGFGSERLEQGLLQLPIWGFLPSAALEVRMAAQDNQR